MSSVDEYRAATQSAALFDRTAQGRLLITGNDRLAFLHALLTNDISRLRAGTGTYSAYLTPQGRMICDMSVIETGVDVWLDVEASVADLLASRLDGLIFSEDVQVRNVTGESAEWRIHGPQAPEVLERVTGLPAARLRALNDFDNLRPPSTGLVVVRDDAFGIMSFDLLLPLSEAERYVEALLQQDVRRSSEETSEVLRVEAARARFGRDMDTETIPLEAGIEDRAISMTKGCYVGQEVIVRVLHRGHGRIAKRLVQLEVAGTEAPEPGDMIASGSEDGKELGRVTSVVQSRKTGSMLALGYVTRDLAEVGAQVKIRNHGTPLNARVAQLCQ